MSTVFISRDFLKSGRALGGKCFLFIQVLCFLALRFLEALRQFLKTKCVLVYIFSKQK